MARPPTPTMREGAGQKPLPARFEPKPGVVVAGKYCVERVIGEGGMGIVALATHEGLEQKVAIKFLLPEAMRNEEVVERFLREAKVAAKVNSEHVARVTDVGRVEPDGVPFIVMEYLEGSDLGAIIDASGKLPLPLDEACEIGLQACEALAEVHAAGIVHRDLKPSNLFVTRRADGSPCVKLLDFGISKFTVHPDDESADPALTATATIMGSPSYMSPEQLRSTKEVDARTDVWALGAVLYEAVTGRPAFRGETVPQVCFMIGSEDPAPPSSVRSDVPPALERAILACLDKKAETRATLVDLARVLVDYAPARARVSLERVEATLGAAPAIAPAKRKEASLPVVPLATQEVARTQSSWHEEEQRTRRKRGGGGTALALLVLVAAGVFGVGVYTGRIDVSLVRGQVKGAASAVRTAAASATAAVVSAIPAGLPSALPTTLPSAIPLPSALGSIEIVPPDPAASDSDEDEDEDDAAAADSAPAASASVAIAPGRFAPAPRFVAPKRAPHKKHKGAHKKHY